MWHIGWEKRHNMFKRHFYSFDEARHIAKRRLPKLVFDYIDGAAGVEYGEEKNREELRKIQLRPRIFRNVSKREISTSIFEHETKLPFGIAPMGICNMVGPHADYEYARVSAKYNTPVGVSTVASSSLEDMAEWSEGHAWFQLYYTGGLNGSLTLLDRAKVAGYKTVMFTADLPEIGHRPRELRHNYTYPFTPTLAQALNFACHPVWTFKMLKHGQPQPRNFKSRNEFTRNNSRAGTDWDTLRRVREHWDGNLIVKGVMNVEDAVELKKLGVDGIQISSHGGRQLDSAPCPIKALPKIREAVGPDIALIYDSGLRCGEDIIKAYALGADFVFMGRPFPFAFAAGGSGGLARMVDILSSEVSVTLAQIGLNGIDQVDNSCIEDTF